MTSALRPLGRRLASLASQSATAASSSSSTRTFSLSAARHVRLPHQPPSPFVASLERFSPVNHKVDPDSGGSPSARFAPRNDFRKVAICMVIFAGILYCIYLPADMPFLSETEYKGFPVEWVEVLGSPDSKEGAYKVITLRLPDEHPMVKGNLKSEAAPYHLMVKDPNLQIERPYTIFPPPPHVTGSATQLSLLVKKEAAGEVSRYIHSLKRFDWPEIRGPIPTLTEDVRVGAEAGGEGWSLRGWDRVVMISGGTGIAPFLQLIHSLIPPERVKPVLPPTDLPTLTLIHASPTLSLEMVQEHLPEPEKLPARLELVDLSPGRVTADALRGLLFDAPAGKAIAAASSSPSSSGSGLVGKITSLFGSSSSPSPSEGTVSSNMAPTLSTEEDDSSRPTPLSPTARTLFLVSGPDGMIASVAGGKGTAEIGGVLGELGFGQQVGEQGRREVRRFWNTPVPRLVGGVVGDGQAK